jgi:hypothetical protein
MKRLSRTAMRKLGPRGAVEVQNARFSKLFRQLNLILRRKCLGSRTVNPSLMGLGLPAAQ